MAHASAEPWIGRLTLAGARSCDRLAAGRGSLPLCFSASLSTHSLLTARLRERPRPSWPLARRPRFALPCVCVCVCGAVLSARSLHSDSVVRLRLTPITFVRSAPGVRAAVLEEFACSRDEQSEERSF